MWRPGDCAGQGLGGFPAAAELCGHVAALPPALRLAQQRPPVAVGSGTWDVGCAKEGDSQSRLLSSRSPGSVILAPGGLGAASRSSCLYDLRNRFSTLNFLLIEPHSF